MALPLTFCFAQTIRTRWTLRKEAHQRGFLWMLATFHGVRCEHEATEAQESCGQARRLLTKRLVVIYARSADVVGC